MNKITPILFAGITLLVLNMVDAKADYGLTITPDTLMPGETATAELCADTQPLTITDAFLVDPSGTLHSTTTNVGDTLDAGDCAIWFIPDDFDTTLTAGSWVLAIDTAEGNPILVDFVVSFFVLPESTIGAIAVTGASIAVFSAYMLHKKRTF